MDYLKTVKTKLEFDENIQFNPGNLSGKNSYPLTNENGRIILRSDEKDAKIIIEAETEVSFDNWSGILKRPTEYKLAEYYKGYPIVKGWKMLNKGLTFSPEFTLTVEGLQTVKSQGIQVFYGDDLKNLQKATSSDMSWQGDDLVLSLKTGYYCLITTQSATSVIAINTDYDTCTSELRAYLLDSDVLGHWGYSYISDFICRQIINKSKKVRPNDGITRSEAVKIALNIYGHSSPELTEEEKEKLQAKFTDVDVDDWAAPFIWKASKTGVANGYDNYLFKPYNEITRMESLKILYMANQHFDIDYFEAGLTVDEERELLDSFNDLLTGQWYLTYLQQAFKTSIMEGYPEDDEEILIKPGQSITRAEFIKLAALISEENRQSRVLVIGMNE